MSFGKFTRQEIIDLISGSWSPYWSAGGGTPGGPNYSIQFNSASIFSGSNYFTYNPTSGLYYTGSFFVSGAISASTGPKTVGFFGTSSWAVSASWAPQSNISFYSGSTLLTSTLTSLMITGSGIVATVNGTGVTMSFSASGNNTAVNINGVDEYVARFSGSNNIVTASFINNFTKDSFLSANQAMTASNQSFMIGNTNKHINTLRSTAFGEYIFSNYNSSSFAAGKATGVNNNYDAAFNYLSQTAPKFQFQGYSYSKITNATYNEAALYNVKGGGGNNEFDDFIAHINAINSYSDPIFIIYDHTYGKLIVYTYLLSGEDALEVASTAVFSGTYRGLAVGLGARLNYTDGTAVAETEYGLFTLWAISSAEIDPTTIANFTNGIGNSAYGRATHAEGISTSARGIGTHTTNMGSVVYGSSSFANNYKNGIWSNHSTATGMFNSSGIVLEIKQITVGPDQNSPTLTASDFNANNGVIDDFDLGGYLLDYLHTRGSGKVGLPAILIIPDYDFCDIISLYTDNTGKYVFSSNIVPTVNGENKGHLIVPSYLSNLIKLGDTQSYDHLRVYQDAPYANFVTGLYNISSNTASFAGGMYSNARGKNSFAFGYNTFAAYENSHVFGNGAQSPQANSFTVGYGVNNLVVSNNNVNITYDAYISRNLIVTGSSYLGDNLNDATIITGSLYVNNSIVLNGNEYISGSLQVTGSQRNYGSFTNIGTLTNTGSVNINGDLSVTGFQVIGGNVFLGNQPTDNIRVTGSVQMTGSLNVIGPVTANNVFLTGSYNGNLTGQVTGSLTGSFIGTGSGNFNGNFIGIYTGSINPGISFYGTSSWAASASVSISSSFSSLSSNVIGGATNYIPVWSSTTSLSSSAATDNGTLFLIKRNTEISGTFENNVSTAINQIQPAIKTNTEGVFLLGTFSSVPTATAGGMYFDGTDFYLGI